jgi:hypothetical protein
MHGPTNAWAVSLGAAARLSGRDPSLDQSGWLSVCHAWSAAWRKTLTTIGPRSWRLTWPLTASHSRDPLLASSALRSSRNAPGVVASPRLLALVDAPDPHDATRQAAIVATSGMRRDPRPDGADCEFPTIGLSSSSHRASERRMLATSCKVAQHPARSTGYGLVNPKA